MRAHRSRALVQLLLATFSALTFVSCGGTRPAKVDESQVKAVTQAGYHANRQDRTMVAVSRIPHQGRTFELEWTLPTAGDTLPVIIYLPGLGEGSEAGDIWRTHWARAGYAVLSAQPLQDDVAAWSSAAARAGDFEAVVRARFGRDAAQARLVALSSLITELRTGQAIDPKLSRRLDLTHVAVAGYDLGAYTAMLIAGETPDSQIEPFRLPLAVEAIVALSPHADFSGKGFGARYKNIHSAVLSVSSGADLDPSGVVSTPKLRRAPFENAPTKDGYLLWLARASHQLLSGSQSGNRDGTEEHRGTAQSKEEEKRQRRHRARLTGPVGDGASGTERAISIGLIQSVTTAFLDAYVKHDTVALEWLRKDAKPWLTGHGQLLQKGMAMPKSTE